jgi:hypothetical protein
LERKRQGEMRTGQEGERRGEDRTGRVEERTGRRGQVELDSQERTSRTGQPGEGRRNLHCKKYNSGIFKIRKYT